MKIPIAINSADWHLKETNIEQIKSLVLQQITLAKELSVKYLLVAGDIFNSRKAQSEAVLNAFGQILDICTKNDVTLICISGNHDKCDNDKEDSFLTPFRNHPNFDLIHSYGMRKINDICFHFLPYYNEVVYLDYLGKIIENLQPSCKNFLITHQGIEGVKNNDGTEVKSSIKKDLFQGFDKVLVGHYHQRGVLNKNIHYIGSICQNNYGEDQEKGFTIVYSNGAIEFKRSEFKVFEKIVIDQNLSKKELNQLILDNKSENKNIRFEFITSTEDKSLIDIDFIKSQGIDVKIKRKDIEQTVDLAESGEKVQFTDTSIIAEFKIFCEKEEVQYQEFGEEMLNKVLNK